MNDEKPTNQQKVEVYSTTTCPYCTMAKQYLTSKGVKFVDHDVSIDRKKAKEMIENTNQMGVPVLNINGQWIVGFNRNAIDEALKQPQRKREDIIGNLLFDPFKK
jgi:glutaredoxin-like YruB-family protein